MSARRVVGLSVATATLLGASLLGSAHAKPFMIVGLDEKAAVGRRRQADPVAAPGKDQVLIVDLADPEEPRRSSPTCR